MTQAFNFKGINNPYLLEKYVFHFLIQILRERIKPNMDIGSKLLSGIGKDPF